MKKTILITIVAFLTLCSYSQNDSVLYKKLKAIPGIEIQSLHSDTMFSEKYLIKVEQPIDHANPELGTFTQRVFICHRGIDKPVVFHTEGYYGNYGLMPQYRSELGQILDANEIIVEHRYFAPSAPDSLDWQYLTVENAANDHHKVIELLKDIYPGKWVSTGISKGGQTAMFHRTFFPDDVDATVAYVCPLNFSDEDLRVYDFLENVGDSVCRSNIFEFQKLLLSNKDKCMPVFEKMVKERDLHYSMGLEAGFELLVLEFSFAYWQWHYFDCNSFPNEKDSPKKWVEFLDKVSGLDWVAQEGIKGTHPFFYQAMTEIGMYGYDLEPFGNLITALDNNKFDFTCPDGATCEFDPTTMQKVDHYIRHEANNMILIYGEIDPWSSTRVQWSGNPGVKIFIKPGGSHRTRIYNMPDDKKAEIYETLEEWMGVEIVPLK